ncbi:MAG: hypothetical protein M3I20_05320 [Mogibacterium diversum]|uniref:Uncharacterized protein n=1 Tax=Mogibacterium diversum TaxID=114527 RepID=A0A930EG52_9FIRM|nr:CD1871A family CXXC motif-containing protein [Mogibacterium diversum]MBF1352890.1 hypothetical protein [Mogibacterium diversum]UQF80852.1 MAG: hypothetical protein M3I20_05320 [Mogibacterium diversum]
MSKKYKRLIPAALIVAGIVMLIIGASRGEIMTVFSKAATVCLECIGIG